MLLNIIQQIGENVHIDIIPGKISLSTAPAVLHEIIILPSILEAEANITAITVQFVAYLNTGSRTPCDVLTNEKSKVSGHPFGTISLAYHPR